MSYEKIIENRTQNTQITEIYSEISQKLKDKNAKTSQIDMTISLLDRIFEARKLINTEQFKKFQKSNDLFLKNLIYLLINLEGNEYFEKCISESKKKVFSNNLEKTLEPLLKHFCMNLINNKDDFNQNITVNSFLKEMEIPFKINYDFNINLMNTEEKLFENFIINKTTDIKQYYESVLSSYFSTIETKIEKVAEDFQIERNNKYLMETVEQVIKNIKFTFNISDYSSEKAFNHAMSKIKSNTLNKVRLDLQFNLLKQKMDQHKIKTYKDYFPESRDRKREIIFYCGPTNSGKTYSAFEELKTCHSGTYLAPLRLLALEGQEEIEKRGKTCSLLTGEEQVIKQNSTFISSTVELVNTSYVYDIAIIDEIQMLIDSDRGWAWSQALVGVNAKKVIVVGSIEALEQVKYIAEYLNEPLTIKHFERKIPLNTNHKNIDETKLHQIKEKSAVVCFSKREVYKYKEFLEKNGRKVSVIYGALSPTVRKEEARRFREGETEILISTDAIGMGLNLPIEQIIISKTNKFNGKTDEKVSPTLIKQICGRAGRFSYGKEGIVSAFNKRSIDYIDECLKMKLENDLLFYIKPNDLILSELMPQMKNKIYNTLKYYKENFSHNETCFVNSVTEETMEKALYIDSSNLIKDGKLDIKEVISLLQSPVSCSDGFAMYANDIVKRKELSHNQLKIEDDKLIKRNINKNNIDFLEKEIRRINIYLWLSNHFKELFVSVNDLIFYREYLEEIFIDYLKEQTQKVKAKVKVRV